MAVDLTNLHVLSTTSQQILTILNINQTPHVFYEGFDVYSEKIIDIHLHQIR